MQDAFGIAAFRSRQQVLKLESALRREGLQVSVITTPRDVALGCGLSVRFRLEDTAAVLRIIKSQQSTNLVGVYQVEPSVGRKSKLTPIALYR